MVADFILLSCCALILKVSFEPLNYVSATMRCCLCQVVGFQSVDLRSRNEIMVLEVMVGLRYPGEGNIDFECKSVEEIVYPLSYGRE